MRTLGHWKNVQYDPFCFNGILNIISRSEE